MTTKKCCLINILNNFKNVISLESGKINLSTKNYNITIKEYNKIKCLLPFKKIIISFKGDVKPECICPEYIAHFTGISSISFIYSKIRFLIFYFISKTKIPFFNRFIEKYKTKYDFIPLPVYKNIKGCWNGKEIIEMRKKIYVNSLECLDKCYLSDKIKHNV